MAPAREADKGLKKKTDRFPELLDFYNENDKYTVTNKQRNEYTDLIKGLEDWQKDILSEKSNIYLMDFSNKGGLVMPIFLEVTYADGSKEEIRLNAEIWRKKARKITRMLITEKTVMSVMVDPHWETADTNMDNNHFPRRIEKSRFDLIKGNKSPNMMKEFRTKLKSDKDEKKDKTSRNEIFPKIFKRRYFICYVLGSDGPRTSFLCRFHPDRPAGQQADYRNCPPPVYP